MTVIAVAAAIIVWTIGRATLGRDPAAGDMRVGVLQVVAASALSGLAAWSTSTLLHRSGDRGLQTWRVLAIGVGLLSLLGPLTQSHGGSVAVMTALHLAVGAVILAGLGRQPSKQ